MDKPGQVIKEGRQSVPSSTVQPVLSSKRTGWIVRKAISHPLWHRLPHNASWSRAKSIHLRIHPLESFRHRSFLLLWLYTAAEAGGFWAQQLTIGWLTYQMTSSPVLTSLAIGTQMLPFALAAPLAGYISDRWDRKKVLAIVQSYQAVLTSGFAVVVALGLTETWHIFLFASATGLSMAVGNIAKVALVPEIVPKNNLVNAFALNILAFNITRLMVPGAAGVMIVYFGPGATLAAAATLPVMATLAAKKMSPNLLPGRRDRPDNSSLGLIEAAKYVRNQPVVFATLLLGASPSLLIMPFVQGLMPTYASEVFAVSASGLGLFISAIGVGGLLGALTIATLGDIHYKGRVLIGSLMVAALAASIFSQMQSVVSAIPPLVLAAGATTSFFAVSAATIHSVIPEEMRSRIASIASMTLGGLIIGSVASGTLASLMGAPSATLIGAFVLGVYVVTVSALFPELRSFGQKGE